MKIDHPEMEQIPVLRQLWQEAFGDSDAFLDRFFEAAFSPNRCLCAYDGVPVAAVYWFSCRWAGEKIAYLYALAVKKSHRRRGLARALVEETVKRLKAEGYRGAVLVLGEPELFDMYGKMGFSDTLTVDVFESEAGGMPAPLRRVSPGTYGVLRKTLLPPGAVVQEEENLAFLGACAQLYAGTDFLLAGNMERDTFVAMEFLGDRASAPAVLAALGAKNGRFRTPGSGREFAQYRSFDHSAAPTYFALAFD